MMMYET